MFRPKLLAATVVVVATVLGFPAPAHADTANFSFSAFDADYVLSRDADQRSQLDATERFTAEFPLADQNHGIERAIPTSYDGHAVEVRIVSVRDGAGRDLPSTTRDAGNVEIVRIGDASTYVHGTRQYVLHYTLLDVTKSLSDHDELYWDTTGTGWNQPFGSVTARLHLTGAAAAAYTGRFRGYQGGPGSTEACQVTVGRQGGDIVLTFRATRPLAAHETITMVTAFQPDTFLLSSTQDVVIGLIIWWVGLSLIVLTGGLWLLYRARRRYGFRARATGVVPGNRSLADISPVLVAHLYGHPDRALVAGILSLAVQGDISIREVPSKSGRPRYELQLRRLDGELWPAEQRVLNLLFGATPRVGDRTLPDEYPRTLTANMYALNRELAAQPESAGLVYQDPLLRRHYHRRGALLMVLGLILLLPGLIAVGATTWVVGNRLRPLTPKGCELSDRLRAVEAYLRVESPAAIPEALLPYAVVLGSDKKWLTRLAPAYQRPPAWYSGGTGGFALAAFASSMTQLSTTGRTTTGGGYSGGYYDTYSGGTYSGGGSSGGGVSGGGGGGGW